MAEDQSKPSNDEKPEKKPSQVDQLQQILDKLGIKCKEVKPPKGFVRIYIPPNNRFDY
jgi:hypothetical protein